MRDTRGIAIDKVIVGTAFALVLFLVAFLYLPSSPLNSEPETKQDTDIRSLAQRYYGYWNRGDAKGMLRLHADSYQLLDVEPANIKTLVMAYDPRYLYDNTECTTRVVDIELIEDPIIPEEFRKQAEVGSWVSYSVTTLVTPLDASVEPFEVVRTWDFIVDGTPRGWRINKIT